MTVTIKVINQGSLDLLRNMESMGLIHMQTPVSAGKHSYRKLRGIHKNLPEASVDEFLARCHADKKRELAMEKQHG